MPNDLERHLARCRRNGAAATLLVVRLTDKSDLPADLEQRLRVSDSWMRSGGGELSILCDACSLDRARVERRLRDLTAGTLLCGWASFPDDGLILEDLVAAARRGAVAVAKPDRPCSTGGRATSARRIGAGATAIAAPRAARDG